MPLVPSAKPAIAVVGASAPSPEVGRLAYEAGREIATRKGILICGGLGGIMEQASAGARDAGGTTVGILPGSSAAETPPNSSIDIPLFTGMGQARNMMVVLSAQVVIAIGGGWGTLSEIALAAKHGRPVVLLASWELTPPTTLDLSLLQRATSPREAVERAFAAVRQPSP